MSKFLRSFKRLAWAKKYAQKYANEHNRIVKIESIRYKIGGLSIEVFDEGGLPDPSSVKSVHPTGTMKGQTIEAIIVTCRCGVLAKDHPVKGCRYPKMKKKVDALYMTRKQAERV